jgi:hypothetical protein
MQVLQQNNKVDHLLQITIPGGQCAALREPALSPVQPLARAYLRTSTRESSPGDTGALQGAEHGNALGSQW